MEKISSWNLKEGAIVGAVRRPDGTLDTSKALRVMGENPPEIKNENPSQEVKPRDVSEHVKNEQEIKDEIMMLEIMQNGSVGIHSSMNNPDWGVGFQSVADNKWLGDRKGFSREIYNHFGLSDHNVKHRNNDEHIREMISLVPAVTDDYKITEVPVERRGLFGRKMITMEKKVEEMEAKPILHSKEVAGGKNEPMFKLMYAAYGNSDDPMRGRELVYTDDNGRPGNMFLFEVLLPESLAKETMEKLRRDPSFIRKLAGEAVVKRTGLKNAEKMWQKGGEMAFNIRPPYEEWDKDSGGKFYFADPKVDPNNPYALNPENVVSLAELKKKEDAGVDQKQTEESAPKNKLLQYEGGDMFASYKERLIRSGSERKKKVGFQQAEILKNTYNHFVREWNEKEEKKEPLTEEDGVRRKAYISSLPPEKISGWLIEAEKAWGSENYENLPEISKISVEAADALISEIGTW